MGYVKKSNRKDDISKEHIVAEFMLDVYRDNGFVPINIRSTVSLNKLRSFVYEDVKLPAL